MDIDILLVALWTDDILTLTPVERAEERVAHLAHIFFGEAGYGEDNLEVGLLECYKIMMEIVPGLVFGGVRL